jgi:hypothetical protein
VEGNLRGADSIEERDLQFSLGATSTSLAFSHVSTSGSGDWCFNYYDYCVQTGWATLGADADTDTEGNARAFAFSDAELCLNAYCDAYARAYARTCAFTKIDGNIDVDTKVVNNKKKISLKLKLKTATRTFALAESEAEATAIVDTKAASFIAVPDLCANYPGHYYCGGFSDLVQITEATADAKSFANAEASSGSSANTTAAIEAEGASINYIKGLISAHASSWSFASAEASASAFANAYSSFANESFMKICIEEHGRRCGGGETQGYCGYKADVACASAFSAGEGWAHALSIACAEKCVAACASTNVYAGVSADVDCRTTPKLTWKCADAYADVSCRY